MCQIAMASKLCTLVPPYGIVPCHIPGALTILRCLLDFWNTVLYWHNRTLDPSFLAFGSMQIERFPASACLLQYHLAATQQMLGQLSLSLSLSLRPSLLPLPPGRNRLGG